MSGYGLIDAREEDDLHKSRLLAVEERPFKRITGRLLAPGSLAFPTNKPLTPPPEVVSPTDGQSASDSEIQKIIEERKHFRDNVLLDFANFDSAINRIQFLQNSNQRERERYESEKQRILNAAQAVRDNTAELRIQLEEAKQALEQRKKFDVLSDKIYNNKLLKPRADQEVNLAKLEEECKELERESESYNETWKERREQFNRIVEEGLQLRRLIRDEKEEPETREETEGGDEEGEVEGSKGGQTPRHIPFSGNATPRADDTRQGTPDLGGLKPNPTTTKRKRPSKGSSRAGSRAGSPAASRGGSQVGSRSGSPAATQEQSEREDSMAVDEPDKSAKIPRSNDTVMGDIESGSADTPRVVIDEPAEEKGEEVVDQMDTT